MNCIIGENKHNFYNYEMTFWLKQDIFIDKKIF